MEIEIDLTKSMEENAAVYFERAKKAKRKMEGLRKAMERTKAEMTSAEKKMKLPETKVRKEIKREWYEKFRWFFSSEDILCIGGRDATSNEVLVKKHTESTDTVCHSDVAGSPFFVIKGKPTEKTMEEVGQATFSYSRAWRMGHSTGEAYFVGAEQVSKKAPSGEYLTKGGFMIYGRKNRMSASLSLAVGISGGRVIGGPVSSVKSHAEKFVAIVPGRKKASEIAKIIRKKIGGEIDEIIRFLPAGGCEIKEERG